MKRALDGKRVVLTRPRDAGDVWRKAFEQHGAEVITIPVTEFAPPSSWEEADRAIEELTSFRWAVFTSQEAVRRLFGRLREKGKPWPMRMRVAAVGEKTAAELTSAGYRPEVIPESANGSEALAKTILNRGPINGVAILFPRAEEGSETLIDELKRFGATVVMVPVYRTETNAKSGQAVRNLLRQNIHWVTFASGSAVRAFFSLGGKGAVLSWIHEKGIRIAVLGATAAEALSKQGGACTVRASHPTVEALVETVVNYESETG